MNLRIIKKLIAFTLCAYVLQINAQIISTPVVDLTFSPHPGAKPPIAFQADGKMIVSGSFLIDGSIRNIGRLNKDGSLDTTFVANVGIPVQIIVMSDKKILVATQGSVIKLNDNGTKDDTFIFSGTNFNIKGISLAPEGRFIIVPQDVASKKRFYSQYYGGFPPQFITDYTLSETGKEPAVCIYEKSGAKLSTIEFKIDYPAGGSTPGVSGFSENYIMVLDSEAFSDGTVAVMTKNYYVIPGGSSGQQAYSFLIQTNFYGIDGKPRSSATAVTKGQSALFYQSLRSIDTVGSLTINLADEMYVNDMSGFTYNRDGVSKKYTAPANRYLTEIVTPGDFASDGSYASALAVRRGGGVENDRVFIFNNTNLVSYKLIKGLSLTARSQIRSTQSVTQGHDVSLSIPYIDVPVQWQSSTDGGLTWLDLSNINGYAGTNSTSLSLSSVTASLSGTQYRYVATNDYGSVASQALTLSVSPLFFPYPTSIAVDQSSSIFVGDSSIHTIQKITSGKVSSWAGVKGQVGSTDGAALQALFNQPSGLAIDINRTLYVSDTANGIVRRIPAKAGSIVADLLEGGSVTTFAGSSANRGSTDGIATAARFSAPIGIARNSSGVFFVADSTNHIIRKITADGTVSTLAGTAGSSGASDGAGASARFNNPTGIAIDANNNILVSDTTNNLIRKISPSGIVTTLAGVTAVAGTQDGAGNIALFNQPSGLAIGNNGILYVADTGNSTIRVITGSGVVSTLAGLSGIGGLKDGTGNNSWFNQPKAIAFDVGGYIYVADTGNAAIRKVSLNGEVTTLALSSDIPTITTQPANLTAVTGSSVAFTVVATSSSAMTYQWKKDGSDIVGATSATYSINSTSTTSAGSYAVVITNFIGSVTSASATLTVNVLPAITTQPSSQSVTAGNSVTFSVVATGTPTPTYQWRKDGAVISGATATSYAISSPASGDAGSYTVVVTNAAGSVTSSSATLTVNAAYVPPPASSGGGGGGAVSSWFIGALGLLLLARRVRQT
jgi:sugar lactone lactonase YvrE